MSNFHSKVKSSSKHLCLNLNNEDIPNMIKHYFVNVNPRPQLMVRKEGHSLTALKKKCCQ